MSGSQKFVFVVSILTLIGAAIGFFGSIATFFAGVAVLGSGSQNGGIAVTAIIISFFILIGSLLSLISGIAGLRAAKDAAKAGFFYIISLISLIFNIIGFIGGLSQNGFRFQDLVGMIMPVLLFIAARNIKEQGRNM